MTDVKFKTKMITAANENIRGSYVNIFEARENDLNGKMEYSMQLLIPKTAKKTLALINGVVSESLKKKFGNNPPASLRNPLRDGDEPTDEGEPRAKEYHGHWFVNISNTRAPGIVDQQRTELLVATDLVSGDYVRVSLNAYSYSNKGNKGTSLGLQNVQLVRKGEPLGNTIAAEDEFDDVENEEYEDDLGL